MSEKNETKYQGLAVGLLLTAPSSLQADLKAVWKQTLSQSTDSVQAIGPAAERFQQAVRHAAYFAVPAVDQYGVFSPKKPEDPNSGVTADPAIDKALGLINYYAMAGNFEKFVDATGAMVQTVGLLLDYSGGSCPLAAEQPTFYAALKQFGASLP